MNEEEEKVFRAKLEVELDPRILYQMGEGAWVAQTGKAGYIDFLVAVHNELLERTK